MLTRLQRYTFTISNQNNMKNEIVQTTEDSSQVSGGLMATTLILMAGIWTAGLGLFIIFA